MELEARAQAAVQAAGAPVPDVLGAGNSPAALGNPFLICAAIHGETMVRRIDRRLDDAGRVRLLAPCAQALAAIHRAAPGSIGLDTQDQLASCRSQLDAIGDTTATFEWAFRWLAARRPTAAPAPLVHGDFRMGNLIVDGSDLAAAGLRAGAPRRCLCRPGLVLPARLAIRRTGRARGRRAGRHESV